MAKPISNPVKVLLSLFGPNEMGYILYSRTALSTGGVTVVAEYRGRRNDLFVPVDLVNYVAYDIWGYWLGDQAGGDFRHNGDHSIIRIARITKDQYLCLRELARLACY